MNTPDSMQYRPSDYRPCVGTMLVNADGMVFVGKRIDNKEGDWWQMPQGGVDDGEDLDRAMLRELGEETGIGEQHLSILRQLDQELYYDLPSELQGKLWKGRFKGQRQSWYLVRFTGSDSDINSSTGTHITRHTQYSRNGLITSAHHARLPPRQRRLAATLP